MPRSKTAVAEFIAAKQAERAARHRRYGESPFVVEPNIKEGRGGLRDLQTLYWMARYVFGTQTMAELVGENSPGGGLLTEVEAKHARRAWDFLWTVRFHLHYVAGRAEERLTFDLQPVVGARMGYTRHGRQDGVERFMRHYFLTAREVAAHHPRARAGDRARGARAAGGRRRNRSGAARGRVRAGRRASCCRRRGRDFRDEPILMLRILQIARDRGARTASARGARADPQRAPRHRAARRSRGGGDRSVPRSCCAERARTRAKAPWTAPTAARAMARTG